MDTHWRPQDSVSYSRIQSSSLRINEKLIPLAKYLISDFDILLYYITLHEVDCFNFLKLKAEMNLIKLRFHFTAKYCIPILRKAIKHFPPKKVFIISINESGQLIYMYCKYLIIKIN